MSVQLPAISERDFQSQVLAYARLMGFLCYHTHRSDHSEPGYPDLTMIRVDPNRSPSRRLIFAELKSQNGRLSYPQQRWLLLLRQIPGIEVYCWRPSSWSQIVEVLQ